MYRYIGKGRPAEHENIGQSGLSRFFLKLQGEYRTIAFSTKCLSVLPTPLSRVTVSKVAISYPCLPFTNRTVPAFTIGRQHRLLQLWSGQIKRCNVNFPERRTVVTLRTICHPFRHTCRVRRSRQRAPRHAMYGM